jgi:hypothetical protein
VEPAQHRSSASRCKEPPTTNHTMHEWECSESGRGTIPNGRGKKMQKGGVKKTNTIIFGIRLEKKNEARNEYTRDNG